MELKELIAKRENSMASFTSEIDQTENIVPCLKDRIQDIKEINKEHEKIL